MKSPARTGLTLVEMLLAVSITTVVAGVLGGLAHAVQMTAAYSDGQSAAAQHARVVLDRISRTVGEAKATGIYPGLAVVQTTVDRWRFPDTLVVWHPAGTPTNADGPPLMRELVLFCPDPAAPHQLVEITAPKDDRPVPLDDLNTAAWQKYIEDVKTASSSRKIVLTDLLRTAVPEKGSAARGTVRFVLELRPSAQEWTAYRGGSLAWDRIAWPQGLYGSQTGMRQSWVRTELQLVSDWQAASGRKGATGEPQEADRAAPPAIPFFGSTALYYEMQR